MPRNSNGQYTLPDDVNPVVEGTIIDVDWANPTCSDLAAAITDSVAASGVTTPTANLPMGGYRHTGVSDPTFRDQYLSLAMAQDGRDYKVTITGGVNNLTGTMVGRNYLTPLVAPMMFAFTAPSNNTGPMTLAISGAPAFSLLSAQQEALVENDVVAGRLYVGFYNGTAGILVSEVSSTTDGSSDQATTTGWSRPESGTYPALVIASGTTIDVPAGEGVIVPAGEDGSQTDTIVTWDAETITLLYVASAFSTTITVDIDGNINQYPGRPPSSILRSQIVLGAVEHMAGAANNVVTRPAIYGDDGYLQKDMNYPLTNMLVAGGRVSRSISGALLLDITQGAALMPGASNGTVNYPNYLTIPATNALGFRTVTQDGTYSAVTTTAPVAFYDNGGVVTPLVGATIHRLYYLYGQFIWAYGQVIYTDEDDALAKLALDRGSFQPATGLADAVLLCEIIAIDTCVDLNTAYFVLKGGFDYSIGAVGGIADAPVDGNTYGRKDAAWELIGSGSIFTTDVEITKAEPRVLEIFDPIGAGWAGLQVQQDTGFDWFNVEATYPDDKVYFRSYNPADGVLRHSIIFDLATGDWTFPAAITSDSLETEDIVVNNSAILPANTTVGGQPIVGGPALIAYGDAVGVDTVVTTLTPTLTSLASPLPIMVRAAGANTTTMTIDIDGLGPVDIYKNNNQPLDAGDVPGAAYWMFLQIDPTLNKLQLINPFSSIDLPVAIDDGGTGEVTAWEGFDALSVADNIASAATTDLATMEGRTGDLTGSATITSFGALPAGVVKKLRATGEPLITYNGTSLITPGGVDLQLSAGDVIEVTSRGSGNSYISDYLPYLNPVFVEWTDADAEPLSGQTTIEWTALPVGIKEFELRLIDESASSNAEAAIQLGHGSTTYITSGYSGRVDNTAGSGGSAWSTMAVVEFNTASGNTKQHNIRGSKLGSTDFWAIESIVTRIDGSSVTYIGMGRVDVTATLSAVKLLLNAAGTFDAGTAYLRYR